MDDYAWPCIHRGAPTGDVVDCGCGQRESPVFTCTHPALGSGQCVVRMNKPAVKTPRGCSGCNFREEPPEPAGKPKTTLERQMARIGSTRNAAIARKKAQTPPPAGESPAGASEVAARHRARLAPQDDKLVYVTSEQMIADTVKLLLPQLPPNLSLVAGVPRSGIAPAAILATHLQLPLGTVNGEKIHNVGAGSRGVNGWAGNPQGKVLIVDDSVYGGHNMRRLRAAFPDALLAALYVRPEMTGLVDFYGRALPSPHLFQWNMFNGAPLVGRTINPALHGGIALDFDGVLAVDPDISDRDEEKYLDWLNNAVPLNLPRRHPVPLIVTFRLEKFREATLAWLARWQIRVDRLVMHPAKSHAERNFNTAEHKGRTYRDSPCRLFVESDPQQARIIFREAQKPVLSLSTWEILQ